MADEQQQLEVLELLRLLALTADVFGLNSNKEKCFNFLELGKKPPFKEKLFAKSHFVSI